MHPMMIDLLAADRRTRALAEAEVRRRQAAYAGRRRRTRLAWRGLAARRLLALARRLDPGVDVRSVPAR